MQRERRDEQSEAAGQRDADSHRLIRQRFTLAQFVGNGQPHGLTARSTTGRGSPEMGDFVMNFKDAVVTGHYGNPFFNVRVALDGTGPPPKFSGAHWMGGSSCKSNLLAVSKRARDCLPFQRVRAADPLQAHWLPRTLNGGVNMFRLTTGATGAASVSGMDVWKQFPLLSKPDAAVMLCTGPL